MTTITRRQSLSPAESLAVKITLATTVGFATFGFAAGAPSTAAYVLSVAVVGVLVKHFRRDPIPGPLALALAFAAAVHLAGGLIRVGNDVLYNASVGTYVGALHTHILQYDHFAHAFATFVGTLTLWTLLVPSGAFPSSLSSRRGLIVLCVLAGLGVGALNETIEFLATIAHSGAHVGGYTNTGWDLVSNALGASAAAAVVAKAHGSTGIGS